MFGIINAKRKKNSVKKTEVKVCITFATTKKIKIPYGEFVYRELLNNELKMQ